MYSKAILLIFLLCVTLCFSKKSLTVLLDTTLSMQEEIDEIKSNMDAVFNTADLSDVENYILIPFKDPEVGPPQAFTSPTELTSFLSNIAVSGGLACPENTLSGIQKALESSNSESYIFIFTDAYANDNSKLAQVKNLCSSTRSQVIIFLSGSCVDTNTFRREGGLDVYFDIAKSCRGGIFQFEPAELRQAFTLMKEILKTDWSEVKTYEVTDANNRDITFSVDSSTTDIMIAVYGNDPVLKILDQNGDVQEVKKIVGNAHSHVIRPAGLQPGNYRARIRNQATIYKRNNFPLQIGFSIKPTDNLMLTSHSPLPDKWNNILLVLPSDSTLQLQSLKLYKIKSNETSMPTLDNSEILNVYTTKAYFDQNTSFQITVTGQDTANQVVTKTTNIMTTQNAQKKGVMAKPTVEIIPPKTALVDYDSHLKLACKVTGYPKPAITWKSGHEGDILQAENFVIEIPHTFVSYATISSLKKNDTIICKAENSEGEDSQDQDLFVQRTVIFEVKQTPQDTTIQYGSEGRLNCEVEAYPEATIQWFHNNTLLTNSGNIDITYPGGTIIIKEMGLDNSGVHTCEVRNEYERRTYNATIDVSGLEAPKITLEQTEINPKPGDSMKIECIVRGTPTPEIRWKYISNDANDFTDVPNGVYLDGGKIKITSVQLQHSGLYRCEAFNVIGQDYSDLTVKIQYAPKIKNMQDDTLTVREGDIVHLPCEVDALPVAMVHWEMSKNDVIVPFDSRHTTDDKHTHSFEAYSDDSGNYNCIAENVEGRVEKTIKVSVLVPPYIETPRLKNITTKIGSSVTLMCKVLYGYPVPSTKWEFISLSSTRTILLKGNGSIPLRLRNITKGQEGSYICIAESDVGTDNIKYYLKVQ